MFIASFFLFFLPSREYDIYFLLADGKRIVEEKKLPKKDVFSFGETRKTLIQHEFLSEVIYYILYKNFGLNIFIYFKAILGIITIFLIFLICYLETKNIYLSSFLTFLQAVLTMYFYNIRPQTFTYFFLASFFLLIKLHFHNKKYPVYLLVFLFLLWSLLHGGSIIGIVLIVCVAIFEVTKIIFPNLPFKLSSDKKKKKLILNLFLSLIVIFVIRTVISFLVYGALIGMGSGSLQEESYLSNIIPELSEWQPLQPFNPYNYHVVFFLIIFYLIFILSLKKLSITEIGIFLLFNILQYKAKKFIPLAVIPSIIVIAECLNNLKFFNKKSYPLLFFITSLILTVYLLLYPFNFVFKFNAFSRENFTKKYLPYYALKFIDKNNLPQNIYNDLSWGGYIIWNYYPKYKVAIDGRFGSVYTDTYLSSYIDTLRGKENWQYFLKKWNINTILIKKTFNIYNILSKSYDWILIYEDFISAVFIKNSQDNAKILKKEEEGKLWYPPSFEFYIYQGYKSLNLNKLDNAELFLKKAISINNKKKQPYFNLGLVYFKRREYKKAENYFKKALQIDENYQKALVYLVSLYYEQGKYKKALFYLERAKKKVKNFNLLLYLEELKEKINKEVDKE
jgi:tetratricopeptide (TPR) repeat protein